MGLFPPWKKKKKKHYYTNYSNIMEIQKDAIHSEFSAESGAPWAPLQCQVSQDHLHSEENPTDHLSKVLLPTLWWWGLNICKPVSKAEGTVPWLWLPSLRQAGG